nr:TOBE-like domain-containing protein [Nocardioides panaciterrulae]
MGFLGEVTRLGGVSLRPHDIDLATVPHLAGAVEARVSRVLRVGFEVRVTALTDDGEVVTVVVTRTLARAIGLVEGMPVWLTPATGAVTVPAMRSVAG